MKHMIQIEIMFINIFISRNSKFKEYKKKKLDISLNYLKRNYYSAFN